MTNIDISYLAEPKLQFGQYFEHEDTKTGLAEFGPFGKNVAGLHPSEIKLGFIGTRETIDGAQEWVNECKSDIESQNIQEIGEAIHTDNSLSLFDNHQEEAQNVLPLVRVHKILNRDFIGFSKETQFDCDFHMNQRWDRIVQPRELDRILKTPSKEQRIFELVNLFDSEIEILSKTSPSPDIIILALTPEVLKEADTVQVVGNFHLNFRRAMKARAMKWNIPIQLMRRSTVLGNSPELQEKATRAWNFCTALYYKADGVPWRSSAVEKDTCFIGISFFVTRDDGGHITMRASVSQTFDYLGQGLVIRGDPFLWDEKKKGRSPHLPKEAARKIIKTTLSTYLQLRGLPPRRVVIHKRSRFWNQEHGEYDELSGFYDGIFDVFPKCETDFVTLQHAGLRLFREGMYPPARGTYITIDGKHQFLYTAGFIPYLGTYPGSYIPAPWQIVEHQGGSSAKQLFKEVLELTKMNVNNCAFADGTPITLSFSEKIGEIMKHAEGFNVQPHYKFYM